MKERTYREYPEDVSGDFLSSFDFIDLRSDEEKRIEREAYAGLSLGPEVDSLVAQLVEIGQAYDYISGSGDNFDGNGYHIRAREIGMRLNEVGGMELMQTVHYKVVAILGPRLGRSLEVAWGYIGDWQP